MDFYDMHDDEIRDHVDGELTAQQIQDVLNDFEDEYHSITKNPIRDEDGHGDTELDPDELSELNGRIVEALQDEVAEELGAKNE